MDQLKSEKDRLAECKPIGHANAWTETAPEYLQCLVLGHNHFQQDLGGGMHLIACFECGWQFTESGEAPLVSRRIPDIFKSRPAPAATPPQLDVQAIISATVTAVLAALDDKAKEQAKTTNKRKEG